MVEVVVEEEVDQGSGVGGGGNNVRLCHGGVIDVARERQK